MKTKFKSQRIMLAIVICTVVASILVGIYSVRYMQERFHNYDENVFEKIVEASKVMEPSDLFENIEEYINDRDIILTVNSSDSVIRSEGLVVGEEFKEIVHKKVVIADGKISLKRKEFDLSTYISNVNVRVDQVFTFGLSDGTRCYYIPSRLVRERDYLEIVLASISIACFALALTMGILNKDITEMMKEEKLNMK